MLGINFGAWESAAGGVTTLILDHFTDVNGTSLSAHVISPTNTPGTSWTIASGTWVIQSNQAIETSAGAICDVYCDSGQVNTTTTCTFPTVDVTNNDGVITKLVDASNYFVWTVEGLLFEYNAGSYTQRASASFTMNNGDTLGLSVSGTLITCYHNGGSVTSYTASSTYSGFATASKIGLHANLNVTGTYDDFTVTTP